MSSLLKRDSVVFDIDAAEKDGVIRTLVESLAVSGKITDVDKFYGDVLDREAISPTCIGFGIGMPHGKTDNVLEAGVCFGRLKAPVIWDAESGETAVMVILLAVPDKEAGNTHLEILAKLSRSLMHEEFRKKLMESDADTVYTVLSEALEG